MIFVSAVCLRFEGRERERENALAGSFLSMNGAERREEREREIVLAGSFLQYVFLCFLHFKMLRVWVSLFWFYITMSYLLFRFVLFGHSSILSCRVCLKKEVWDIKLQLEYRCV